LIDSVKEFVQVAAGEGPVEGLGGLAVFGLETEDAVCELSARPARQRPADLRRKLGCQRLDLGDLAGGKTTGDAPAVMTTPPECITGSRY
jgi:hypothetical protein